MNFIRLEIPDVVLIQPKVHWDPRGYFFEAYRVDQFAANGIPDIFVQDNFSQSSQGVLRGLHYQIQPKPQSKLVRVLRGSLLDVAVDIRPPSKTFGKYVVRTLTAESKEMLYIPTGFAHGFCALEDETEFMYKVSNLYSPEHERGIVWNDPAIGIPWPAFDYVISEKDRKYPTLKQTFSPS